VFVKYNVLINKTPEKSLHMMMMMMMMIVIIVVKCFENLAEFGHLRTTPSSKYCFATAV